MRRDTTKILLFGGLSCLISLFAFSNYAWATPDQNSWRLTVPTRTPTPVAQIYLPLVMKNYPPFGAEQSVYQEVITDSIVRTYTRPDVQRPNDFANRFAGP